MFSFSSDSLTSSFMEASTRSDSTRSFSAAAAPPPPPPDAFCRLVGECMPAAARAVRQAQGLTVGWPGADQLRAQASMRCSTQGSGSGGGGRCGCQPPGWVAWLAAASCRPIDPGLPSPSCCCNEGRTLLPLCCQLQLRQHVGVDLLLQGVGPLVQLAHQAELALQLHRHIGHACGVRDRASGERQGLRRAHRHSERAVASRRLWNASCALSMYERR